MANSEEVAQLFKSMSKEEQDSFAESLSPQEFTKLEAHLSQKQVPLQEEQTRPFSLAGVKDQLVEQAPIIGAGIGSAIGLASPIPGGAYAGAGIGGYLGQAVKQYLRPEELQQRLQGKENPIERQAEIMKGPVEQGAYGTLGEMTAGAGGKLVEKGVKGLSNIPGYLKDLSESTVLRGLGAQKPEIGRLQAQGLTSRVPETAMKEGIVTPFSTGKTQLSKGAELKQETGAQLGALYSRVGEQAKTLTGRNAEEFASSQIDLKKLINESKKEIQDKFTGSPVGEQTIKRLNGVLKNYEAKIKAQGQILDPGSAREMKTELDQLINHAKETKDLPAYEQGLKLIRNKFAKKIDDHVAKVDELLGTSESKELKKLNKLYGEASAITELGKKKVKTEQGNRFLGLSEQIGGAALGSATFGKNYNSDDGLLGSAPEALGAGLLGVLGSKYMKKFGANQVGLLANRAHQALAPAAGKALQASPYLEELAKIYARQKTQKAMSK